jgi:hypothetical protein
MPVNTSNETVQSLDSVNILLGGSIDATIKFDNPMFTSTYKTFHITRETALPYWSSLPNQNAPNRWEDLCGILYEILLAQGAISGTIG